MARTWYTRKKRNKIIYPRGWENKFKPGESSETDWSRTTQEGSWWIDEEKENILNSRTGLRKRKGSLKREYWRSGVLTLSEKGGRRWQERDLKSDRLRRAKREGKARMKARLKKETCENP